MLAKVFLVFTEVLAWIVGAFGDVVPIFYDNTAGELTLVGTMTFVGLGIAVISLIINWVSSLLHFGR